MIKNIINILFLLLTSKCQNWWDEVNGHLIDDSNYGFAGSFGHLFTDFYLCSDRKYRVHYLNDKWSEEFTACQPAGNCENNAQEFISTFSCYSSVVLKGVI